MDDLFQKIDMPKPSKNSIDEHESGERKKQYHSWSTEEEQLLCESIMIFGKNWVKIQQNRLPYLTPVQIKNKYYTLAKKSSASESMSQSVSEIEASSKSIHEHQAAGMRHYVSRKGLNTRGDELLQFNIFQNPDFLDFDEFTK